MGKISVMLGCCLASEEMEKFMNEYPDYFDNESIENNDYLDGENFSLTDEITGTSDTPSSLIVQTEDGTNYINS